MVDIGPPPAGFTFYEANAISEEGTVVGTLGDDTSGTSFFWTKATGIKEIPIPSSFATGISRGFVIGASSCLKPSLCDINNLRGFIWHRHLGAIDLGTLPGDNTIFPPVSIQVSRLSGRRKIMLPETAPLFCGHPAIK